MPKISEFHGIKIIMYFGDHDPPHFHVWYGSHRATCTIGELHLIRGHLPARVIAMVREWAKLHQGELEDNWRRVRDLEPTRRIAPLP